MASNASNNQRTISPITTLRAKNSLSFATWRRQTQPKIALNSSPKRVQACKFLEFPENYVTPLPTRTSENSEKRIHARRVSIARRLCPFEASRINPNPSPKLNVQTIDSSLIVEQTIKLPNKNTLVRASYTRGKTSVKSRRNNVSLLQAEAFGLTSRQFHITPRNRRELSEPHPLSTGSSKRNTRKLFETLGAAKIIEKLKRRSRVTHIKSPSTFSIINLSSDSPSLRENLLPVKKSFVQELIKKSKLLPHRITVECNMMSAVRRQQSNKRNHMQ